MSTHSQSQPNYARLRGQLTQIEALRYTPAGVPVLQLYLQHRSQTTHEGFARQLDFQFEALALGATAEKMASIAVGTWLNCEGFLAPKHRGSNFLVLHVQQFACLTDSSA